MKIKYNVSIKLFFLMMCLGISFKNLFCVHLYGQCQCDIITSPTSPITIPKGEFVDINLRNTNCESYIKVVGNLPPGLIDVSPRKISGWPTVAGTYSFLLQAMAVILVRLIV